MQERELTKRWGVTDDCAQTSYPPKGWMPTLDRLMSALAEIPGWDPSNVLQVKSKFGGLRFYYGLPPDASDALKTSVSALVQQFEAEANRTCERCGSTEGVNTNPDQTGWLRTECQGCLRT